MVTIMNAKHYYGRHAVGAVVLCDGRVDIHLASRREAAQWAKKAYLASLSSLTRVIREHPGFYADAETRLSAAIDSAEQALGLTKTASHDDRQIIHDAMTTRTFLSAL